MLDPQSRIRRPSFVCGYRYSYTARNPPTTRPSIPTPIPLRPAHRHNHGAGPPLLALTSRPAATAHRAHPPAIDPPTKSPTNQPTRPPTNQPTNYQMWQLCTYMFYISPLKPNASNPTQIVPHSSKPMQPKLGHPPLRSRPAPPHSDVCIVRAVLCGFAVIPPLFQCHYMLLRPATPYSDVRIVRTGLCDSAAIPLM